MGASGQPGGRGTRRVVLAVALLALAPSLGTLAAPWIAEDADILARVARDGPWADWTRPQYGLELLRFWRPVVSATWALQESLTGIAPLPLRAFNLLLHAAAAGLAAACAARLGAGLFAAFLCGAWIALFPEQGGTCTWIAGRTDLLAAALLLATVWTALGPEPRWSGLCAFLASAAKEFGFLAPLWVVLLARGGGASPRDGMRRARPAALGAALAFAWRWAALGGPAGGYAAELPGLWAGLAGSAAALFRGAGWTLAGALLLAAAGCLRGRAARGWAWPLWAALAALLPLGPLLADGLIEPQNRRLFFVPECALALALALAWSRPAAGGMRASPERALAVLVLLARGLLARGDVLEWEAAALAGEEQVARARLAVLGAEPCERPVLLEGFATAQGGAYCLGYGVAARFRAPFPAAPRPVWPWRLAFVAEERRARVPRVAARPGGGYWPLDDLPGVGELELHAPDGPVTRLALDRSVLRSERDDSPRLELAGASGEALEALVATEIGYEAFPLAPAGASAFTLRELVASSNGVASVGDLLLQTADLGGRRAFLELRALGADGAPRAASAWIPLDWSEDLVAAALSGR